MNRPSVQVPIILGFSAMLLILFTVVATNVYQIRSFGAQIRAIVLERNKKSDLAAVMNELHRSRYRSLLHASALADPFQRDEEISYFRDLAREFIKARDQFTSLPLDDSEAATWESIRAEVRSVETQSEIIVDALQAGDLDTAKQLIKTRLAPLQDMMMAGWNQMLYVQNEKNREALRQSDRIDNEVRRWSLVLGGAALLIGLGVAIFVVRTSRRLEQALREEKERAQVTLASISEAVVRLNGNGQICFLNPYAEYLLGVKLAVGEPCKPESVLQLLDGTTRKPLTQGLVADLRRNLSVVLPARTCLISAEGMEYEVEGSGAPLSLGDDKPAGAVLVLRDVTETRNSLRQRSGCAGIDPITGLTDTLQLEERLSSTLLGKRAEDQPLAFLLVRLDNLEEIRAQAGNGAVDALFLQVGRQLQTRVRDSDMLSRLDDTAFGILLLSCPETKAAQIAGAIRETLHAFQLQWGTQTLGIKAHVGRVQVPPFSGTLSDCLRAASKA